MGQQLNTAGKIKSLSESDYQAANLVTDGLSLCY